MWVAALAVGACAELPIPPALGGPTVTCQDPPTITITDAAGRESNLPIRLTCEPAVAAARAAAGAIAASSIDFRYGNACPGRIPCPFAPEGDRGHVVFTTPAGDIVVTVWVDDRGVLHADPPQPFPSDGF